MTVQSDIGNVMRAVGNPSFAYHTFGAAVDRLPKKARGMKPFDVTASVPGRLNEPETQTAIGDCAMPLTPADEGLGVAPDHDMPPANRGSDNDLAYVDGSIRDDASIALFSASHELSLKHVFELISR